jgi:L-ascorbate oxidase
MANRRRYRSFCTLAVAISSFAATAAPLKDPVEFKSAGGQLDLIMVATEERIDFNGVTTKGWVYDVCRRASPTATECLAGTSARHYGGVWLHLQLNDTLHIRLVNKLPPLRDSKHCNPDLANNPTNLHTHGLIVEPHRSTGGSDAFGDYVFVEVRNPTNHSSCTQPPASAHRKAPPPDAHAHDAAAGGAHPDMDLAIDGGVEYAIHLVRHPTGLFWFHPHMHGVALNQVTSGLSGVITVGEPADECGRDADCRAAMMAGATSLLVLRDSEVLADGTLLNQQESTFCPPTAAADEAPRHGVCAGDRNEGYAGGHWFHTINGQLYPDIAVGEHGALWQFVNSAGSRSYDLSLAPEGGGQAIPLQILSIDGVTIDATLSANLPALQAQLGRKMTVFRCPDPPGARHGDAVCTRSVRMMPSSRVTVRVLNDQAGARQALLRTADYDTGGDDWPAIDLASVSLASPAAGLATSLQIPGGVKDLLSPSGALGDAPSLLQPGAARPAPLDQVQREPMSAETSAAVPGLRQATAYAIDPALKLGLRQEPSCANLAPGEYRRIYFGNPHPGKDDFGLATSVIGTDKKERDLTPMRSFNPTLTTICLTASRAKGRPTTEVWEVLNLTNEDHNFHVHQTRFSLVSTGPPQPGSIDEVAVLQDNVPLRRASHPEDCDGSIEHFKSGACKPEPVVLRIPFTQIGDFVFHCHILEHEDGGMMARIRVVAPPARDVRK